MEKERLQNLAAQFMRHAVNVIPGDNVWVEYMGSGAAPLMKACADEVRRIGANPHIVNTGSNAIIPLMRKGGQALADYATANMAVMKTMQAYIRIDDDADAEKIKRFDETALSRLRFARQDITEYRIQNTRWLIVSNPSKAFARACNMSYEAFKKFYYDVNMLDYSRMEHAARPLETLLREGQDVHVKGRGADLKFSIAGMGAKSCYGLRNRPDGECFTAPVRDSVNGHITFGPSFYEGQRFEGIYLEFKDGKAVRAMCSNPAKNEALNAILDRDKARYVGEFALAFNPYVLHPTSEILFDEKIAGSIHIALGGCYKDVADNGNYSDVHWDMVHIQRPDYGGGEIWIDGKLIRKDGIFVTPELRGLNPDRLTAPSL